MNNLNGFLYINRSSSYAPPVDQCVLISNPPSGKGVAWGGKNVTWTKGRMMVIPISGRSLLLDLELEQKNTLDFCNA